MKGKGFIIASAKKVSNKGSRPPLLRFRVDSKGRSYTGAHVKKPARNKGVFVCRSPHEVRAFVRLTQLIQTEGSFDNKPKNKLSQSFSVSSALFQSERPYFVGASATCVHPQRVSTRPVFNNLQSNVQTSKKLGMPVFIGFGRLQNDSIGVLEPGTVTESLWRFYRGSGVFIESTKLL